MLENGIILPDPEGMRLTGTHCTFCLFYITYPTLNSHTRLVVLSRRENIQDNTCLRRNTSRNKSTQVQRVTTDPRLVRFTYNSNYRKV